MSFSIQRYKSILSLGLPILVGQVGMIIVGFADTTMVGHYSTNALAAASFVNNLFNVAILACLGMTMASLRLPGHCSPRSSTDVWANWCAMLCRST